MALVDSVVKFLVENKGLIGSALSMVVLLGKASSGATTNALLIACQKALDMLAGALEKVGALVKVLSDLLAHVVKSDGLLGRK